MSDRSSASRKVEASAADTDAAVARQDELEVLGGPADAERSIPGGTDLSDLSGIARASLGLDRPRKACRKVELGSAVVYVADGIDLSQERLCCAVGAFDGMHLGHRTLVKAAMDEAARLGCCSAIVTFEPDPADVLVGPVPSSHLLLGEDRLRMLQSSGAEVVVLIRFDKELAHLEGRAFLERLTRGALHVASLHVGTNFRFGYRGACGPGELRALGHELGFATHVHELLGSSGEAISATRIRGLLHAGRVEDAADLLGRCHFVRGSVKHGRGEGTSFGFPTANVVSDPLACMPQEGVYACLFVKGDRVWPAAANVGAPPTFSKPRPAFLEANVIGFSGDLYGDDVAVIFVRWLRGSRPFSSTEELERVVLSNIAWVQEHLGDKGREVMD